MAVTDDCGPHCGIASGMEGHCSCPDCHAGIQRTPVVITRQDLTAELRGRPMCDLWYKRSGGVRPWEGEAR